MEKEPSKLDNNCTQSQFSIEFDQNTNYDSIQSFEMTNPNPETEMQIKNCEPEATTETSILENLSKGEKIHCQCFYL